MEWPLPSRGGIDSSNSEERRAASSEPTSSYVGMQKLVFHSGRETMNERIERYERNEPNVSAGTILDPGKIDWSVAVPRKFDSYAIMPRMQSHSSRSTVGEIDEPQSSMSADDVVETWRQMWRIDTKYTDSGIDNFDRSTPQHVLDRSGSEDRRSKRRTQRDLSSLNGIIQLKRLRSERRMRFAAAMNNVEVMKLLLSSDVSPDNCDQQGRTPLHFAAGRGYSEIVDLLLKHGANPKRRDCIGNTPLHLAAVTSKIDVVTLLLEAGTDPLTADLHGYNPLQLAETKLRRLQNCQGADVTGVKNEVRNVVNMLKAFLKNRQGSDNQVEALSEFCSRLTLSHTSDEVKNDVQNLLTNIDNLQLES